MAEFDLFKEVDAAWHRLTQYPGPDYDKPSFRMGFEACVELLDKLGWHPASKLPQKSERIIVCYKDKDNYDLYTSQPSFLTKDNEYIGVPEYAQKTLMWCYPPQND